MDNKALVLDIETSPIVAYVWGLKDQNISPNQIKDDWYVMAWSAKWLNDPPSKIIYRDQRNSHNPMNDRAILAELWELLDRADIVITQNGQHFDGPKLNARFILHGLRPPSPYRHLDTYQIVKRVAQFTSNKLEFLTDKICEKYKKVSHGKYPGMVLWRECMAGNLKAWKEMERYNKLDVLSTEELYLKIRAWAPNSSPSVYLAENKCSACGSNYLTRRGFERTKVTVYQRLQCKDCGKWHRGGKINVIKTIPKA